jgi:hypothetical protein
LDGADWLAAGLGSVAVVPIQRAIMRIMQTFKAAHWEHTEFGSVPGGSSSRTWGCRAPGRIVLVVQEGTGWVPGPDGSRETVESQSVAIFDTGDWFQYGSDSGGFTVDTYWETDLPEEERKAMFAEAFDPEFVEQAWPESE